MNNKRRGKLKSINQYFLKSSMIIDSRNESERVRIEKNATTTTTKSRRKKKQNSNKSELKKSK
jgi:hypothetical protein